MAAVDDIRSTLDVSQIAQFLGTDEQTAEQAVDQALNQLVGSMGGNATDPQVAVDLSRAALNDHVGSPAYGDTIDINNVDTNDGEKIVNHVFSGQQVQTLGGGAAGGLLQRLLPLLAPIVMGYLASKLQERMGGGARAPQQQAGGGLGDILGDLLGGGSAQRQSGGGGFGDILGDLLGGGSAPQQQAPTPQAPAGADRGFKVPTPGTGDGTLRMDPGTPSAQAPQQQAPAGGAGDLLGGLLQDILLGGRR